jgi:hypothetical protein
MKTHPTNNKAIHTKDPHELSRKIIDSMIERQRELERQKKPYVDPMREFISQIPDENKQTMLIFCRFGKTDEELLEDNPELKPAFDEWRVTPRGKAICGAGKEYSEWASKMSAVKAEIQNEASRLTRWKAYHDAPKRIIEQLNSEIGSELRKRVDPSHPDIDWRQFKAFALWRVLSEGAEDDDLEFKNAILSGPQGCGKSRALAYKAFQMALTHRYFSFAWTTGARFAELVSNLGQADERSEAKSELKRLAEVDFLFFDDLGSSHFTGARISHFFVLMDERYQNNRATFFTTNHGVMEIRRMLSRGTGRPDDASQADRGIVADRIIRRMVGTSASPKAMFFKFNPRKYGRTK